MREVITTLLDTLGLLLIAAGIGLGLFPSVGWWSVAVAGGVVLIGSQLADAAGADRSAHLARLPGRRVKSGA